VVLLYRQRKAHGEQVQELARHRQSIRGFDSRPAFITRSGLVDNVAFVPRAGSIDSLSPESYPSGLRLCRSAPAGSVPARASFDPQRRSLGSEVRNLLSRRRSASVSRLVQRLSRHCSRHFFRRMLDRTVSCRDRFSAKRRRGFRRKERSEDRECLRSERNENDHDRCCTLHGGRSYQNPTA